MGAVGRDVEVRGVAANLQVGHFELDQVDRPQRGGRVLAHDGVGAQRVEHELAEQVAALAPRAVVLVPDNSTFSDFAS